MPGDPLDHLLVTLAVVLPFRILVRLINARGREPGWRIVLTALLAGIVSGHASPRAQTLPSAPPALLPLVDAARRDLDRYWASRVLSYRPPVDVVMVRAPQRTDCAPFPHPNAEYCRETGSRSLVPSPLGRRGRGPLQRHVRAVLGVAVLSQAVAARPSVRLPSGP